MTVRVYRLLPDKVTSVDFEDTDFATAEELAANYIANVRPLIALMRGRLELAHVHTSDVPHVGSG